MAILENKQESNEEEIERLTKAIENNPKDLNAYLLRAITFISLKQNEKVIADLNEAIDLDTKNSDIYLLRALILTDLKRYEDAILDYDKGIELGVQDANIYYNRGCALYGLKQYEKAIKDYNKSIHLGKQADTYLNKGKALYNLRRYKEAINNFSKAIELDPNNTHTIHTLGYTYSLLGQWKKAAITFNKAKEDVLDVLTIFNKPEQIENLVSYMLDSNKEDFFNKTTGASKKRIQYKSIYIIILQILYLLHIKNEHEISFAHYTKRSTATFLLFENSKLRLNSTITANDPQEGKTLIEYLFGKESLDKKRANRDKTNHDYQAFIGCFTFNHESLNQFRLYGKEDDKEATGVSLVLNKNFFNEKIEIGLLSSCSLAEDEKESRIIKNDGLQKYALFRCIYIDPVTQKIISLGHKEECFFYNEEENISENTISKYREEINDIQKKIEELFNKLSTKINNDNLDKNIICELLLPLRYLVKHVAFKEEQECRIFDIKDLQEEKLKQKEDREVKFTPDYAQMYIEYQPITDEHLEKVIFAPKARGIEIFKKAAEQKGLEVECEVSTHPFS